MDPEHPAQLFSGNHAELGVLIGGGVNLGQIEKLEDIFDTWILLHALL